MRAAAVLERQSSLGDRFQAEVFFLSLETIFCTSLDKLNKQLLSRKNLRKKC